jgi:hypothetical protein
VKLEYHTLTTYTENRTSGWNAIFDCMNKTPALTNPGLPRARAGWPNGWDQRETTRYARPRAPSTTANAGHT